MNVFLCSGEPGLMGEASTSGATIESNQNSSHPWTTAANRGLMDKIPGLLQQSLE